MDNALITVDLTFGDAGKGSCVDFLAQNTHDRAIVIRYNGGAQCGHNVVTDDGNHHTFNQFGSATLRGVPTFYGKRAYFNPLFFALEAARLNKNFGINDAANRFFLDSRALLTTPYHRSLNCLVEMSRGDKKHGSCGAGIGYTASFAIEQPELGVTAHHLRCGKGLLGTELEDIRDYAYGLLKPHLGNLNYSDPDVCTYLEIFSMDPSVVAASMINSVEGINIVDPENVKRLLANHYIGIFEGAQGVLLDENFGFHPYTTWSTTTSKYAYEFLAEFEIGLSNKIEYGLTRSFSSRHGAGPFPAEAANYLFDTSMFKDRYNPTNKWQGNLRIGPLDFALLTYALKVNGPVDKLVISWLDVFDKATVFPYITEHFKDAAVHPADWKKNAVSPLKHPHLGEQERITNRLFTAQPFVRIYTLPDIADQNVIPAFIAANIDTEIGIISRGPKASDKQLV